MRGVPLTSFPADPFKASGTEISQSGRLKYFKYRLLASVAGLDRGFTATPEAARQVEDAVSYLLSAGEPVNLSWTVGEAPPSCLLLHVTAQYLPATKCQVKDAVKYRLSDEKSV